jgi:hypothetical protein
VSRSAAFTAAPAHAEDLAVLNGVIERDHPHRTGSPAKIIVNNYRTFLIIQFYK